MSGPSLVKLSTHRWLTDWPIAELNLRVDELLGRLGVTPDEWEEDGLGTARGALVRLSTGRVFLLQELAHAIRLGRPGPTIAADVEDVAAFGPAPLIAEVLEALGLSRSHLSWEVKADAQASAENLVRGHRERNATGECGGKP
jgi:hypothetical protein